MAQNGDGDLAATAAAAFCLAWPGSAHQLLFFCFFPDSWMSKFQMDLLRILLHFSIISRLV
jgi:hypothetical protein